MKGNSRTGTPFVEAGEGLSYAAIHEYGGMIKPVEKQWLTIPISQEAFGKNSKEVDTMLKGQKKKLIFKMTNPSTAILFEVLGKQGQGIKIHFVLKKQVNMPERSYLRSAGSTVMANQKEYVNKIMGGSDTPWKVS